jgi:predicted RNase H-like HicB family nuclease
MKYHFSYKIDDDGIWGNCCEVPELYAQADTLDDFKKNCEEALNLMLEEPEDSKVEFGLPEKKYDKKKNTIQVPVYPEVAFGMLLRMYRLKHGLTQKQAAEKLGMKNVYSYQRLEKKSNPTLSMLKKVTEVFPDMQMDMLLN